MRVIPQIGGQNGRSFLLVRSPEDAIYLSADEHRWWEVTEQRDLRACRSHFARRDRVVHQTGRDV
jgi:hypothetical protein